MSGLIKSGEAAQLAPLRLVALSEPRPLSSEAQQTLRLEARIIELEDERERLLAQAADLRRQIELAFDKGKEDGRSEGLAAADDRREERLAILRDAAQSAGAALSTALTELETVAVGLAVETLDIMFGETLDRRDAVVALVRHQLGRLDAASLVRIEVAADDFGNDDDLAVLAALPELRAVTVIRSAALRPGDCRMTARIGELDLGLTRQWSVLKQQLDALECGA
jgi:flagellar biosynthesis/type III secretory pathway protein FliH